MVMPTGVPNRTVVDSRGSACPGPITDLSMAYRRSKAGDVIEVWATDPGFREDVKAWATKTGNQLVSVEEGPEKIVAVLRILRR
ncbi:MAG: sulfurtransferase TusA family protein [Candidatus Dormibacteraeota bacterium]|jgi:TusA-related sulfurtransferase|nr:sulfurtransferase TusA family protein [Candidatus Dormibacteraeota bacterium]